MSYDLVALIEETYIGLLVKDEPAEASACTMI